MLQNQTTADSGFAPVREPRKHNNIRVERAHLYEKVGHVIGSAYNLQLVV